MKWWRDGVVVVIFMCGIVITTAIVGAWLLESPFENPPQSITAQDVIIVGEVRLRNWRHESRRVVIVAILVEIKESGWCSYLAQSGSLWKGTKLGTAGSMGVLEAEVSSEGGAISGTTECPRKEEQSQKGARSFSTSRRCLDFFLGPAIGLSICWVCCLFRMLLRALQEIWSLLAKFISGKCYLAVNSTH